MTEESLYDKRGVSASKEDVHAAIENMDKGLYPTAFCKILPDVVGKDNDYCNIMHADTAGTKTSLAYIYWKETGDMSVWKDIVQDALVMNLDDMACVGCFDDILISSTIGRNKSIITKEVIKEIIQGPQVFFDKMKAHGINLDLAGGETADVGDIVRTLDVGYTTFCRLKKEDLLINNIQDKNVIVGFSSYGQATYEDRYNGGMGSNGLTSARHDVFNHTYFEKYPESFNPNIDEEYIYSGSMNLTDTINIDGKDMSVGKLVLSPTRTYLPLLKAIFDQGHKDSIDGIIHCTGGAQTKVLHFVNNVHIIKDNLLDIPPLFELIAKEAPHQEKDLYTIFNMGHRLEIYTDEATAKELINISATFNIEAQIIGRVEKYNGKKVTIKNQENTFEYT